jgi:hypothetical protein
MRRFAGGVGTRSVSTCPKSLSAPPARDNEELQLQAAAHCAHPRLSSKTLVALCLSMPVRLFRAKALLLGFVSALTLPVSAKPEFVDAYFYQFQPSSCRVSLAGYGSATCEYGVLSVAADNKNSVNIHLVGRLGHWQLMLSDGATFAPVVDVILIRSTANLQENKPSPAFYYTTDDRTILDGKCTPIIISSISSGRCVVKLADGKTLDVSFATQSLRPADNVQKRY